MKVHNGRRQIMGAGFIFNLLLMLCAYGILYRGTFNGDTLDAMTYPEVQAKVFMGSGRYLFALIWEIAYRVGINMGKTTGANVLLTVLLMSVSAAVITSAYFKMRYKDELQEWKIDRFLLIDSVILMGFLNLLSLELLFFSAYALMPGVACVFVAFSLFAFADKRYVLCGISLACSVMVYQAYIGMFIIFALAFVFVEHHGKLNKYSFWKSAVVVAGGGSLCLLDIYSTKILAHLGIIGGAAKKIEMIGFKEIFITIFKTQISIMHDEYDLSMISFLPFILLAAAGVYILCGYIKGKKNFNEWFYLVLLTIVSNLCAFAVLFGGYLYVPPRVLVSYWSFISAMVLLALYVTEKQKSKCVMLVLVNIVTFLHIINSNVIISDLFVSNRLDKNYVLNVEQYIEEYEEKTGVKITTIGIGTDTNCEQYWTEYVDYYTFNINERCVSADWHFDMLFRSYTGRDYQKVQIPENIYEEYFEGRDWNGFNPAEQLVFVEDKLYLMVY
ncbi:MAG: glucosyltransferase domain-containing protein [Lachnospiraceae bacterium]|nr:glucosyltransferase domain-containing protein [Lachnospiraceae bacterium]